MFSSFQVSLEDSSLEADHIISAIPASGNGIATLPFPSQGEAPSLLPGPTGPYHALELLIPVGILS